MNDTNRRRQAEAADRRRKAWAAYLKGTPRPEIAEAVGVSAPTLDRYIRHHTAELTDETRELADQWRDRALARSEALIAAKWDAALEGDDRALVAVQRTMALQCRIVGQRIDVRVSASDLTFEEVEALTDKELDTVIADCRAGRPPSVRLTPAEIQRRTLAKASGGR